MRLAFTLVELIVVITILAILGTIAFISLNNFSASARDAKRLSDIRSLYTKLTLENVKGTKYEDLINIDSTSDMIINGENKTIAQGVVNFEAIKENRNNFLDPTTNSDYPVAFHEAGLVASLSTEARDSSVIEIATINEEKNLAVVMGNYFPSDERDSVGLIVNKNGKVIVNGGGELPYNLGTDDNGGGPLECSSGYSLNPSMTECEPSIDSVIYWTDEATGFSWEKYPSEEEYLWSIESTVKPIWNGEKYTSDIGNDPLTSEYPPFAYCSSLGRKWRLPTVQELYTLVDFSKLNTASIHENLLPKRYWTGEVDIARNNGAWFIDFSEGVLDAINKADANTPIDAYDNQVICIYEDYDKTTTPKYITEPDTDATIRFTSGHSIAGIPAMYDTFTGKYWEEAIYISGMSWDEHNERCNGLGTGGWRLPTIKEIISIRTSETKNLYGRFVIFPSRPPVTIIYSSDLRLLNSNNAWRINSAYGNVMPSNKSSAGSAICIHD